MNNQKLYGTPSTTFHQPMDAPRNAAISKKTYGIIHHQRQPRERQDSWTLSRRGEQTKGHRDRRREGDESEREGAPIPQQRSTGRAMPTFLSYHMRPALCPAPFDRSAPTTPHDPTPRTPPSVFTPPFAPTALHNNTTASSSPLPAFQRGYSTGGVLRMPLERAFWMSLWLSCSARRMSRGQPLCACDMRVCVFECM